MGKVKKKKTVSHDPYCILVLRGGQTTRVKCEKLASLPVLKSFPVSMQIIFTIRKFLLVREFLKMLEMLNKEVIQLLYGGVEKNYVKVSVTGGFEDHK
jgi:hypothetical protein